MYPSPFGDHHHQQHHQQQHQHPAPPPPPPHFHHEHQHQHQHHDAQPHMPVWASRTVRLSLTSQKNMVMTHCNFVGLVRPAHECHVPDTVWRIVPGLADPKCVSIQSTDRWQNYFLRHGDFKTRIDPFDNADIYRKDATFAMRPALDGGAGVSFESFNYPNYFVVQEHDQLVLRQYENSPMFFARASWKVKAN